MRRMTQDRLSRNFFPQRVPSHLCTATFCSVMFCATATLSAQSMTVQQPAFGRFSVGTSVVVPDRGRAFLGSVSRAGESRSRFGPFPSGTSTGLFREHSGLSTHVWIHDLREMDRLLLQQGRISSERNTGPPLSPAAEHAYRMLRAKAEQASHRKRAASSQQALSVPTGSPPSPVQSSSFPGRKAKGTLHSASRTLSLSPPRSVPRTSEPPSILYYRLGQQAEKTGNIAKAASCYRLAARYGSKEAARKLSSGRLDSRSLYRR